MWALVVYGALTGYFYDIDDCRFSGKAAQAKYTCVYVQRPLRMNPKLIGSKPRGDYKHPPQGQ